MITRTTAYTIDLDRPTVEDRWDAPLTYGDKSANIIQATLMRGAVAAALSNATVMLYGVLSDGTTTFRAGTVSGNVVTCELDYTFYAVPGKMDLLVQLSEGTTVTNTPLRITAHVKTGQTGELVSSGEQFSLAALQAIIAGCETAAENADTKAGLADTAAGNADTKAALANTAAGLANEKAGLANTAAANANAKAALADAAKARADTAAQSIEDMTVSAVKLAAGSQPTVEESTVDGHKHLTYGLVTGDKGEQGAAFLIKSSAYATVAALEAAITQPQEGDQYNVGSAAPYHIYRWTGAAWEDQGQLQGQTGATGPAGADGLTTSVDGVAQTGGNVALTAVRYGAAQSLTAAQQTQARSNLGLGAAAVKEVTNGLTQEAEGYVLDGRQGKALKDLANQKATVQQLTAALPVAGWSASAPYTQTVTVTGMLATDTPLVDIVLSSTQETAQSELESWTYVSKIETGAGSVTVTCFEDKPEAALTLTMKVVR